MQYGVCSCPGVEFGDALLTAAHLLDVDLPDGMLHVAGLLCLAPRRAELVHLGRHHAHVEQVVRLHGVGRQRAPVGQGRTQLAGSAPRRALLLHLCRRHAHVQQAAPPAHLKHDDESAPAQQRRASRQHLLRTWSTTVSPCPAAQDQVMQGQQHRASRQHPLRTLNTSLNPPLPSMPSSTNRPPSTTLELPNFEPSCACEESPGCIKQTDMRSCPTPTCLFR